MFAHLETSLVALLDSVSLEFFVFIASIVEEIVAPIPSPTVMVISGAVALNQGYGVLGLPVLAVIGACGKVLGALVLYAIADYSEDLIVGRFGRFFGVTHEQVESFGNKLGKGLKDYVVLTAFRAAPFIPSVVVSVGSGVLKIPLKMYIVTTFFGTIIRDGFYLYAGYFGTAGLVSLVDTANHLETIVEALILSAFVGVGAYIFYRRRSRKASAEGLSNGQ